MWGHRRPLGTFAGAVLLALAACTGTGPDDAEPETAPPLVEHPKAEAPQDRDPRAVLAALRQLDMCVLLDTALDAVGNSAAPVALDPFWCTAKVDGSDQVSVDIRPWDSTRRAATPSRPVGGAKAYVTSSDKVCTVALPITFEHALFVSGGGPPSDTCATVEPVAAAIATTLTDPTAARREPIWDVCSALAAAGEDDAEGSIDVTACGTRLSLRYGALDEIAGQRETIGGRPVATAERPATGVGCRVTWRLGPASSDYATEPDRLASVAGSDCASARELAEAVMTVLDSPPPADTPQQPLLYRPDEPDAPQPDACAYLDNASATLDCQPYVEVPVPSERAEIVRAAEVDPHVYCALALPAVTKHFGTQMRPVVVSGEEPHDRPRFDDDRGSRVCYFVEPERTVQVVVGMWLDPPSHLARDLAEVQVAGHPGYVNTQQFGGRYEIWVGMTQDPDQDGMLALRVEPGPVTLGQATELDPGVYAKAQPVLADIIAEYFS